MARETWRAMARPNGKVDLVPLKDVDKWVQKHRPAKRVKLFHPKQVNVERGSWVIRDGKLVPKHLATPLQRAGGVQIIRDSEPFLNIAVDGAYIGGRRQRRDMIRAHNLVEVGNDAPVNRFKGAPEPSQREMVNDVKQAYRDHGVDVL